jgi:hypothetical protein
LVSTRDNQTGLYGNSIAYSDVRWREPAERQRETRPERVHECFAKLRQANDIDCRRPTSKTCEMGAAEERSRRPRHCPIRDTGWTHSISPQSVPLGRPVAPHRAYRGLFPRPIEPCRALSAASPASPEHRPSMEPGICEHWRDWNTGKTCEHIENWAACWRELHSRGHGGLISRSSRSSPPRSLELP